MSMWGQAELDLHYCVIDFEFPQEAPCLTTKITVRAFPHEESVEITHSG